MVAVVVCIDESGGCGSVPLLKVNERCKCDRGCFCVVEGICGKITIEFWESEEVDDEPSTLRITIILVVRAICCGA